MFTIEQILAAHSKVKSGADFPAYIQEIKNLGVTHYVTYVTDGHTDYHGESDFMVTVPAKNAPKVIANVPQIEKFKAELLAHQQGKTDYPAFLNMCSETGVEKWEISMKAMTCSYFSMVGEILLVEKIPE